jgi:uncharacterized protein (TIGR02300 family)
MSNKALRGTKRVCPNCGSRFYDLNNDPATCPVCQTVYHGSAVTSRAAAVGGNAADADDDAILDAGRGALEFVPLDEVAAAEGDDLPDIEAGDAADDGDAALETAADDEAFLETEDEGEADVSGFVGGGSNEDEV